MGIKKFFIKEEEENTPQEVNVRPSVSGAPRSYTASVKQEDVPTQPITPPSVEIPSSTKKVITADDVIVNKIWDKIIAANRPGPDYLELKNNVEALEDLPISNEQKLISAFKVLKKGYPNFEKDDSRPYSQDLSSEQY